MTHPTGGPSDPHFHHFMGRQPFFALDLLAQLQAKDEEARRSGGRATLPRVAAFSRGMHDEMVRAALSEFLHQRVDVRKPGGDVTWGKRLDVSPDAEGGVLWAMFDRAVLRQNLYEVCAGEAKGAMAPPPEENPVWDEFLPNSCLASFHNEFRDMFPDVWRSEVLGSGQLSSLSGATRKAISRLGHKYIESNPVRGNPTWRGYAEIARRLADPS